MSGEEASESLRYFCDSVTPLGHLLDRFGLELSNRIACWSYTLLSKHLSRTLRERGVPKEASVSANVGESEVLYPFVIASLTRFLQLTPRRRRKSLSSLAALILTRNIGSDVPSRPSK